MNSGNSSDGASLIWNGPGSPVVTPIAIETTEDSSLPIFVEIKIPPRDWGPPAFTNLIDPQLHPDLPTTTTESAAPPEVQQLTTKGGHNDDQEN